MGFVKPGVTEEQFHEDWMKACSKAYDEHHLVYVLSNYGRRVLPRRDFIKDELIRMGYREVPSADAEAWQVPWTGPGPWEKFK